SVGRRFHISLVEDHDRFGRTLDRAFQFGFLAIADSELELHGINAVGIMAAVSGHGITAVKASILAVATQGNVVSRKNSETIGLELPKDALRAGYSLCAGARHKLLDGATVQRPAHERLWNSALGVDIDQQSGRIVRPHLVDEPADRLMIVLVEGRGRGT